MVVMVELPFEVVCSVKALPEKLRQLKPQNASRSDDQLAARSETEPFSYLGWCALFDGCEGSHLITEISGRDYRAWADG
jgi:hypothetical protein